jgi:predicted dehydrogenase
MRITTATATVTIDFGTRTTTCHRADETVLEGKYAPHNVLPDSVSLFVPTFMNDAFTLETQTYEAVDALAAELDDFVCAILSHKPPRVSGSRALEAVSVAETIVRSIGKSGSQRQIRRAA